MDLVSTNFDSFNDNELELAGDAAIDAITGNENFAEAQQLVTKAAAVAVIFKAAKKKADTGDRSAIATRNKVAKDYRATLRKLAYMVNALWADDRAMLLTSGIRLIRERVQPQEFAPPAAPVISHRPIPTSLLATATKTPGAKVITYMCTPAPATSDSVWIRKALKKKKCLFTNLASGTKYCFKIEVTGKDDEHLSSETVSFWTLNID